MTGPHWPELLAEHRPWLRTVVLARLGEAGAAEEVLQEVALAAVASKNPPPASAAAPWLHRLAVRQALLYRRKAGRRRRLLEGFGQTRCTVEGVVDDGLHWLLSDERGRLVRRGLAQLSGRDREILLLKYAEDWTYQMLATRLGISPSAIESRLHRARARLRAQLAALDPAMTT